MFSFVMHSVFGFGAGIRQTVDGRSEEGLTSSTYPRERLRHEWPPMAARSQVRPGRRVRRAMILENISAEDAQPRIGQTRFNRSQAANLVFPNTTAHYHCDRQTMERKMI